MSTISGNMRGGIQGPSTVNRCARYDINHIAVNGKAPLYSHTLPNYASVTHEKADRVTSCSSYEVETKFELFACYRKEKTYTEWARLWKSLILFRSFYVWRESG